MRRDFRAVWRRLTTDGQLVWLGPDKGPLHQAAAGLINALWDIWAKVERLPVWQLVARLNPEELVAALDFSYVRELLSEQEALEILSTSQGSQQERAEAMIARGYPAYTTSVGWAGYSEERVRQLCEAALQEGFTAFKMKVGMGEQEDARRAAMMRRILGWDRVLMMDANSVWDVPQAIDQMHKLSKCAPVEPPQVAHRFRPYWIEEPTSPDDAVGHAAIAEAIKPIHVATGEQMSNRVAVTCLLAVTYTAGDAQTVSPTERLLNPTDRRATARWAE